jgi:hypothetical protein
VIPLGAKWAIVSLPDVAIAAQISCARQRLVVMAPGFSESVAKAIVDKWHELGKDAVQVILDPDPEVCRLGFGDLAAVRMLFETAECLKTRIQAQQGLRVGVVITDETTTVFSPTARLVEAGGKPGELLNGIQLDVPALETLANARDLAAINLHPKPLEPAELKETVKQLDADPPLKFDLARRVRVFNAKLEFVEFELHGMQLARKRVQISSDLIGLADPRAEKLMRSTFQLMEEGSDTPSECVSNLKRFIVKTYLTNLPRYGTIILRKDKENFLSAVKTLERYVLRFQRQLKLQLQAAIDKNKATLAGALLPSVIAKPPKRWRRLLSDYPNPEEVERVLNAELAESFGSAEDLIDEMEVKIIFKGVTYESLNEPGFVTVVRKELPWLKVLHEEYDAAKGEANQASSSAFN